MSSLKKPIPNVRDLGFGFFGVYLKVIYLSVEDVPAVEMSVFAFGDFHEVFPAIVQGIVVDVVDFHMRWTFEDQSVHTDCVSFALNDLPGNDVFGIGGF